MIRKPQELTESIRKAVDHRAVLYSHLLLAIILAVHTGLDPATTRPELYLAIGLSSVLVVLIFLRVFDMGRVNNHPLLYITFYQIFVFLGFTFISDPATPYVIGLFLVVFFSNLYYGAKGVWITVACFGVTTVAKYFWNVHTNHINLVGKLNIVVAFLLFVGVCSLFVNIQKVYDWDRAKLRETVKKEALEQKRLRALINNMTESVLVLDKEGIIRLYNASALLLLDTNDTLNDKPLANFVHFEDGKKQPVSVKDLLPQDNNPMLRNDVSIRYSEEDTAALSIVSTPIRSGFGGDDSESGYVVTLRDITREKSLEEERNEFISVISHELRTPVTIVEAGVSNSLLIAGKLPGSEKVIESLKTAHDQSIYLANILNDLSTFARAEKGTLETNLDELNTRELLDMLKDDYHDNASAKNLTIECKVDKATPAKMVSNRLYIREILQNFVTNSIKYSDKGTITLEATPADGGVLFSVHDEGIGISVSDQKKVFDKFYRAEDFRTRSTSGTGLGLYITRKLSKILDARIELHSEVGKGSTFSVYIPDKSEALKQASIPAPAQLAAATAS
jgi:signal transduction histidine kinase